MALARHVGLSATPCLERVKAPESSAYISGCAANLSASKLGLGITVFIQVQLVRTAEKAFQDFREAVLRIPEMQFCHMAAGSFDYLIKLRVSDMDAYRKFFRRGAGRVPGRRYGAACARSPLQIWLGWGNAKSSNATDQGCGKCGDDLLGCPPVSGDVDLDHCLHYSAGVARVLPETRN